MANNLRLQLEILTSGATATVGELRRIREESARAAAESKKQAEGQETGNSRGLKGISELAFQYNEVVRSLQNLQATAQPVYDALIGSNEKLNAQILSSQTNLASSVRIFKGDTEITDPTAKIQASAGKLRAAIKQIEIDTQSLVGVTSSQVNELFQITLTNAGALNQQSKQFPDAISAATSLTKGWAASLKVVGIPLNQARQEINSIIKGQITQDSILAKNLNITNQQVEKWRSQGVLVDELNKKLEVFVAGNGIAARSIEGISSNILDLSERITRNIGEPFLEPTINALAEVEKYLKGAEASITLLFGQLSAEIISAGGSIGEAFAPAGKTLLEIGEDLGPIALSAIKGLLQVFVQLSNVIGPLANLLLGAVKIIADFAATDLGGVVVQTAAVILVMSQLTTIIGGLAVAALPLLATAVLSVVSRMLLLEGSISAAGLVSVVSSAGMGLLSGVLKLLAADAIALNFALIPLTAAIGLGVLLNTSNNLKNANNDLETYGNQILVTADAYGVIGSELNKYNKIVKDGGTLTEEQLKRQKQLRASAEAQVEGIQVQIKNLKDLKTANSDQSSQRDNDIKQLEALAAKFDKAAGGIKLQSKSVDDLGTTSELAASKLANLKRLIASDAGGDKPALDAAFKDTISLTQLQIKNYELSAEAGIADLEAVKNNTKAELETRFAAKDAIVSIRKQQLDLELAAITTEQSKIAALTSQQRLGEAKADEETTKLKLAEFAKRAEANKVAIASATTEGERNKLRIEGEKDAADGEKLEAELSTRKRKRAIEDFDERRNLIKAQNDLGLIDRGVYNQQVALNDIAQNDVAIAQQRQALAKLGADDKEGREAINSQIAQLQSKKMEILRVFDQADLKRQTEYFDQELTSLEAFKNQKLISEDEFVQQRAQVRIAQADAELVVANRELTRLGANDIEGRNAINTKINELGNKRLKALEESYAAELVLIKDRQARALDLVNQSEKQRAIDLHKLVNNRTIRLEDAEKERNRQTLTNQKAELKQAQDFKAALARTAGAARSPEAERAYQQQVREARSRTLGVTLQLLQTEGTELERLRTLALKGIEDEAAARARFVDLQLSQIAVVKGARDRAGKDAEASANREVFAIDLVAKTMERQNSLLIARNNLQKANFDAAISGNDLELARVNRAIEIRKRLNDLYTIDGKGNVEERIILMRELADLTQNSGASEYELVQQKLAIEQRNAEVKRESILFEQAAATAALSAEQQKIDLSNQRAVIEARIAELKARQGVLDAESVLRQQQLTSARAIDAANLALEQAKAQQPGKARDRAVADAGNKVKIARNDAVTGEANAVEGIDLARQQAYFANQITKQSIEQQKSFASIKDSQTETLKVQQGVVLKQLEAAEAAKRYADELERAKAALTQTSTQISKPLVFEARARGGNVNAGQPYIVGENSPEVFVPRVSGTVLNREQILKNLGSLGGVNLNVGGGKGNDNREVTEAIRSLEQTILSRPPTPIIANFAGADDGQLDKMFAIQRSALRIN